jgi:parallel beta-helix repeat protein
MFTIVGISVLAIILLSNASARTITVDDGGGQQYTSIRAAVNAANAGDTIYIYSGIYNEQVMINKSINLQGENNQNTIIKGTGASLSGIYITTNYVNVSNLKVENFGFGIYLYSISNNIIASNTVANCSWDGIYLYSSSNNIITSNIVANSNDRGILFYSSSNNNITSNTVANCSSGIYLYSSSNNKILYNAISSCKQGIYLLSSSNNNITCNNIYGNKEYGLYVVSYTDNTARNNWWGNATGPSNAISNPDGKGDRISGDIPFSPWAKTPFGLSQPRTIEQPLLDESTIFFMIITLCVFISLIAPVIYVHHKNKKNGGLKNILPMIKNRLLKLPDWHIFVFVFALIVLSRLADIGTTYIFDKNLTFEQNMFIKELGFGWNFFVIRDILAIIALSILFLYYLAVRKDCYPKNSGYTIGKFALFLTSGKDVSFLQSFFKMPCRKNFFMTISFMLSTGTLLLGFTIGVINFLAGTYYVHLLGRDPLLKIVLITVVYAIIALGILIGVSFMDYKKMLQNFIYSHENREAKVRELTDVQWSQSQQPSQQHAPMHGYDRSYPAIVGNGALTVCVVLGIIFLMLGAIMIHVAPELTNKEYASTTDGAKAQAADVRSQRTIIDIGHIMFDIGAFFFVTFLLLAAILRRDLSDYVRFGLLLAVGLSLLSFAFRT